MDYVTLFMVLCHVPLQRYSNSFWLNLSTCDSTILGCPLMPLIGRPTLPYKTVLHGWSIISDLRETYYCLLESKLGHQCCLCALVCSDLSSQQSQRRPSYGQPCTGIHNHRQQPLTPSLPTSPNTPSDAIQVVFGWIFKLSAVWIATSSTQCVGSRQQPELWP